MADDCFLSFAQITNKNVREGAIKKKLSTSDDEDKKFEIQLFCDDNMIMIIISRTPLESIFISFFFDV
jgi:hypothetical protein